MRIESSREEFASGQREDALILRNNKSKETFRLMLTNRRINRREVFQVRPGCERALILAWE